MEKEKFTISVTLDWNNWIPWNDLKLDARKKSVIKVPNESGVYEVKYGDAEELLYIGRAANLRMRVKQGLVKGKVPHSAGERMRPNKDTSRIVVRWAITDKPAAAEEGLHQRYLEKFGKIPK